MLRKRLTFLYTIFVGFFHVVDSNVFSYLIIIFEVFYFMFKLFIINRKRSKISSN